MQDYVTYHNGRGRPIWILYQKIHVNGGYGDMKIDKVESNDYLTTNLLVLSEFDDFEQAEAVKNQRQENGDYYTYTNRHI